MKPFIRTIFIWILSLSLTGLPVIVQAQSLADLDRSEKDMAMAMKISDENVSGMPCHAKKTVQADVKMMPEQRIMQAQNTVKSLSMKSDCCGDDCQCNSDMSCQSAHHSGASAILQTTLFISSPLNSQLTTEFTILYHDCDTALEVIPPIA